jgi:hypothetical protein
MEPLIDILAELNQDERSDFTLWFSGLTTKERDRVASLLANTTLKRIRTVLSIPASQRVAFFGVPYTKTEELGHRIRAERERLGEELENSSLNKSLNEFLEDQRKKLRKESW